MSEEQVAEQQQDTNPQESEQPKKEYNIEDLIKQNEELTKKLKTVADHKDKLYQETKRAKADQAAAAEQQQIKNQEYEKLYNSKNDELNQYKKSVRDKEIKSNALAIATELADGNNAKLLSKFIAEKLDHMLDGPDSLSDDVLHDIKNEFAHDELYRDLLKRSKATGGNALGNTGGKPASSNEIGRADFEKLSQYERGQFFKNGGKLK